MISAEEKEKSILNYMQTLSLTREEAEQLWNDDNSDELLPEQQELEEKAKKNLKRQYEINPDKVRKKVEKERKVNLTKKMLLENFAETLECLNITDYTTFTETEIDFKYNDKTYTLKLTEHKKGWSREEVLKKQMKLDKAKFANESRERKIEV
jgi:hypothetical protein